MLTRERGISHASIRCRLAVATSGGKPTCSDRMFDTHIMPFYNQTRLGLNGMHMETVNIYDAKTRLSQLVDKAAGGEDVIVSRNGKPLVRITRLERAKRQIRFGVLKGKIRIAKDFDAPLPEDVLAAFEGR